MTEPGVAGVSQPTWGEEAAHLAVLHMPRAGEFWRHYNGGLYRIFGTGHRAEDGGAVVIYAPMADGWVAGLWVRPIGEFLGFTSDHKRRFVRVDH